MLYVPGVARGVLFGGYMQYSPANAVGCSQGYHPLEPEMLLFCCCFCLRCFLIVLKDFIMLLCSLCSLLFLDPSHLFRMTRIVRLSF